MSRRSPLLLLLVALGCGGKTASPSGNSDGGEPWPDEGCPPSHEFVAGRCRIREVFIPGGTFVMGRGYCEEAGVLDEPQTWDCPLADAPHVVTVKPFWVDATVFPRAEVDADPSCPSGEIQCASQTAYEPGLIASGGLEPDPINGTGSDYECFKLGKRPLDEAEWEFIATWGGTRTYPWGDEEPSCARANIDANACAVHNAVQAPPELARIASYPPSPEGIFDLIGNAGEFVAPAAYAYSADYTSVPIFLAAECGQGEPGCELKGPIQGYRGGRVNDPRGNFRSAFRGGTGGGVSHNKIWGLAFRCARSAE